MLTRQIALVVKDSSKVEFRQLSNVSAALQAQATRDFGPVWGVTATVDAFADLNDIPPGYWPIVVQDDIHDPGAGGVHEDSMGQPFALVEAGPLWSLAASHECLEMLADPFGNRTVAGAKPVDGGEFDLSRQVEFLVEVCDPCEDPQYGYFINGILVSDFYTPEFFNPPGTSGARYDFTGNINRPLQVLENGYISWHDPNGGAWWQTFCVKNTLKNQKITPADFAPRGQFNVRSRIDRVTPSALEQWTHDGPLGFAAPFESPGKKLPPLNNFDSKRQALIESILSGRLLKSLEGDRYKLLKAAVRTKGHGDTQRGLKLDAERLLADIEKAKKGEC